jgi:hypothetical protein
MKPLLALTLLALLTGCEDYERQRKLEEMWAKAVLVKVCIDGTRIYRLEGGLYVTGGWGTAIVENPETVCTRGK